MKLKKIIITLSGLLIVGLFFAGLVINHENKIENNETNYSNTSKLAVNNLSSKKFKLLKPAYVNYQGRKAVDWKKPTTKAYVDLTNVPASQIKLVIKKSSQTLNVYVNDKLIEQFLVSTGKGIGNYYPTPSGKFAIQSEHGEWFYNGKPGVNEGARNWISFKDHGLYLFHSVVMNKDNEPIMSKQGYLGHKLSHGCIQMSLPDNLYIYRTFSAPNKVGTKVIIDN